MSNLITLTQLLRELSRDLVNCEDEERADIQDKIWEIEDEIELVEDEEEQKHFHGWTF